VSDRQLTIAGFQMLIAEDDIESNESAIHRAINSARDAGAKFLLTPEASLSGYNSSFDGISVSKATNRLAEHAKDLGVGLLLGTCYKESHRAVSFPYRLRSRDDSLRPTIQEFCFNQVRVYTPDGRYLGRHSKIQMWNWPHFPGVGEEQVFATSALRTFHWNGITFGVLICNDLWGALWSRQPENLAYRLWEMGAEIIFHAVYAGFSKLGPNSYLESYQSMFAKVFNLPIVTAHAADPTRSVLCQSGVWNGEGERLCAVDRVGEKFFTHTISLSPKVAGQS